VSASIVEAFLARIYVDAQARARFLSNPTAEARAAGLSPDEVEAVKQIDQIGLELLAISLERKRQKQCVQRGCRNHFRGKRRA
jgi:hypothetical protein